jgi:hypothetical protein
MQMLPHFFQSADICVRIFVPLCITSRRITPSEAQNTVIVMFLAVGEQSSCTFPSSPPVTLFCPAIYSTPTECSIAINVAKPFMDVPHHFFLCRKEPLSKHVVCDDITGRLHFEELQQRCHVGNLCKFILQTKEVQKCTT